MCTSNVPERLYTTNKHLTIYVTFNSMYYKVLKQCIRKTDEFRNAGGYSLKFLNTYVRF